MIKNPYKGKYVAMEGIDGCGKSTQCVRAFNYLSAGGEKVIMVKEPNKEVWGGKLIYSLLFKEGPIGFSDMNSLTRQIHYFWNRMRHVVEVVIPALEKGVSVISDRCFASVNLDVHQKGDLERLLAIQDYYFETVGVPLIRPDLIVILDIRPEMVIKRWKARDKSKDFFEEPGKMLQTMIAYQEFVAKFPDFCRLIDASENDPELVFGRWKDLLHQHFELKDWGKKEEVRPWANS